ncbi:MAG: hypothetical protein JW797_00815 [Bradymonadales bacterium]|nr:hypothetical protein [Bradymonadales bacterium]
MDHRASHWSMLLVLGASVLLCSCSGSSQYEQVPLEEARALNSHLSAFYSSTRDLLENVSRQVNVVGDLPGGIRPADFEIQLVKNTLIDCFNQSISITQVTNEPPRGVIAQLGEDPLRPLTRRPNLDHVEFCNPRSMISLESYLEYTPTQITEFITDRVLLVDALRVNLKHVLQERFNLLQEQVDQGASEVVRLREQASERYGRTMSSGDASPEQQLQTQADYEQIQTELDDIQLLLARIQDDLRDLGRFRRQLVDDVVVRLTAMGEP